MTLNPKISVIVAPKRYVYHQGASALLMGVLFALHPRWRMSIEGFRSLNQDIQTIINKSEKVKEAKKSKESLSTAEKKELNEEEKEYKNLRKKIQEGINGYLFIKSKTAPTQAVVRAVFFTLKLFSWTMKLFSYNETNLGHNEIILLRKVSL